MQCTFLLVSDIHHNLDNIKNLKAWLIQKDRLKDIDFIIASGDLVNADYITPLTTEKDELEFREVIDGLENIDKPLYYIPGNHDPESSFLPSAYQRKNENSKVTNFHNKIINLVPGLSMVGFGGSTAGVARNSPEQIIWPAYPRNTESLLAEKLPILLDKVEDEIILVTHVGPSKVGTTDVDKFPLRDPPIESGSTPLSSEDSSQCNIMFNIHGHSHFPFGLSHLGQTFVINPGSLQEGRFAILTLENFNKEKLLIGEVKDFYKCSNRINSCNDLAMDLFHVLGSGARFDKKRFNDDISLFEPQKQKKPVKNVVNDQETQASLLQEIDFFHNSKSAIIETLGKKQLPNERLTVNNEDESTELNSLNTQDNVKKFRKRHRICVYGTDIPNPFHSFSDLHNIYEFQPYLCKNLDSAGYKQPTPIQMQAIPIILHGRDVMAMAPTGSGKTLAYILPILHDLNSHKKIGYRALIISPTRELAKQIYIEFKKMCVGKKFKICLLTKATAATQAQDPHLKQKFDILISTPLRLVHAISQDNIDLKNVQHLVLDEADKLLELGFLDQTDEIFAACSNIKLQKYLFSATLPSGVESLANNFMKDPIRIVVGLKNAATETIKQQLIYVGEENGKLTAIRQMIQEGGLKPPVLIFVQSIERAKELFHELIYDGINVDVIHAERTKAQRDSIVLNFRQGKIWVLIATELMARGIDFKGVNLVINYDFPQSIQSYIHRIGRTGRAVNVMKDSGCEVPNWMLELKNPSKESKQQLRKKPIKRKTIDTRSNYDKKKIKRK
ncbi:7470_t:CDS:10, partial [Gigaspora margarita]